MLHGIETRRRFLELKSEGFSHKEISDLMGVSKTTCRRWFGMNEYDVLNPKRTVQVYRKKSKCNVTVEEKGEALKTFFGEDFFESLFKKNYSFNMIREKIIRDMKYRDDGVVEYTVLSKQSFRKSLYAVGYRVNTSEYNKMPQSWKLQYKFPKNAPVAEICSAKSRSGQRKTVKKREENGSYKDIVFEKKNSPFCAEFYEARGLDDNRADIMLKGTKASGKSSGNKLEKKVENIIKEIVKLGHLSTQFKLVNSKNEDKRSNFLFDFYVETEKGEFLIEVNGDYYHGNPLFYNRDDILNFPGGKKLKIKDIWAADKRKQSVAIASGYSVVVIWENDVNFREEKVKEDLCMILLK